MPQTRNLTVYHVAAHIDGAVVEHPSAALRDARGVVEVERVVDLPFEAWLYRGRSPLRTPPWVAFLTESFEDAFQMVRGASAVLFVRAQKEVGDLFAFTFGQRGRYLLRPDAYDRNYGLRTAINLIYGGEEDTDGPDRIRSVDSKTVEVGSIGV